MTKSLTPRDWSDDILREVFRHADVGFVLMDLHGTIHEANESFCRMIGLDRSSVAALPVVELVAPEQVDETRSLVDRLGSGEIDTYRVVRRYVKADGDEVSAKVIASVVRSPEGELICGIELVEDIGPRLAAEQALRDSELRYRRIVEDQGEYIVRWTPDGTRTFVNEAYARYVGKSRGELIGTSFYPLIAREEDREAVREIIRSRTPGDPVATSFHQATRADGKLVWHQWTDRAFFDAEGNITELQSVGRDVTEEHLATQALHESEARHRRLFQDLPVAAWESDWTEVVGGARDAGVMTALEFVERALSDPTFPGKTVGSVRVLELNDVALDLYGVESIEEYREWVPEAWPQGENPEIFEHAANIIFNGAEQATFEVTLKAKTGVERRALIRWARSRTEQSDWHIIATAVDLSELRMLQKDLERHKRILERAEEIAGVGSWEWNSEAGTVFGSREYWRILDGRTSGAQLRDESAFFERVHPEDVGLMEGLIEEGGPGSEEVPLEIRIVRSNDDERIIQTSGFYFRDAASRATRGFGIIRDVTDEKLAERIAERQRRQLIRADRLISLGTLVGGVAHEVNNPNQFIMLNAPLMRKAWDDIIPIVDEAAKSKPDLIIGGLPWSEMRDEAGEISNDILQGAERINAIVSELKGFAREGAAGPDEPVDVNDVVQGAQRLVGARLRRATDSFLVELGQGLPVVRGNKQHLEQVVINLLLNASDAVSENRGEVSVSTRWDERTERVVIEVRDEGKGIEPDALERVFDPFYTTKRTEGGTGLGLAISSRIVSEHGGQISFESKPKSGTTVFVRLPAGGRK